MLGFTWKQRNTVICGKTTDHKQHKYPNSFLRTKMTTQNDRVDEKIQQKFWYPQRVRDRQTANSIENGWKWCSFLVVMRMQQNLTTSMHNKPLHSGDGSADSYSLMWSLVVDAEDLFSSCFPVLSRVELSHCKSVQQERGKSSIQNLCNLSARGHGSSTTPNKNPGPKSELNNV